MRTASTILLSSTGRSIKASSTRLCKPGRRTLSTALGSCPTYFERVYEASQFTIATSFLQPVLHATLFYGQKPCPRKIQQLGWLLSTPKLDVCARSLESFNLPLRNGRQPYLVYNGPAFRKIRSQHFEIILIHITQHAFRSLDLEPWGLNTGLGIWLMDSGSCTMVTGY